MKRGKILTYKNIFDRIFCLVLSSKILSVAFHNQCSRHIFHAKIYPSKWSGTGKKDNISSIFLKRSEVILEIQIFLKSIPTSSKIGLKHLAQSFWSCLSFVNMLILALLFNKCHQKGSVILESFFRAQRAPLSIMTIFFIFYDILEETHTLGHSP